jgi:thiamine pyrophosphokinase
MSTFDTIAIIVNGELPSRERLNEVWRQADCVVCTDGAINNLIEHGLVPQIVIGDLDSIDPQVRASLCSGVEVHHVACQESTDLEKAFRFAIQRGASTVLLSGLGGGRLDHALTNMAIVQKFSREVSVRLYEPSGYGVLLVAEGAATHHSFSCRLGMLVSLVPFGRVEGITTTGLKFPLRGESLEWGVREGVSNQSVAEEVVVTIERGVLLLFSDESVF